MLEGNNDPVLEAEGELALARVALDGDDLGHAASHLAGAIGWDPTNPQARELVENLVRTDGEAVLDLFPLDGRAAVGTVVARAYVLGALGRQGQALPLLASATVYDASRPWADLPWMSDPDVAAVLNPELLTRSLMHVASGLSDPISDPQVKAATAPYLALAANAVAAHDNVGLLMGVASSLARRVEDFPRALSWAQAGVAAQPGAMTELYLASALRAAGQPQQAVAAFERAIGHDPLNLALYSDLAETLARDGKLDEAIDWISRAHEIDPDYDCVVHVGQRLRFQRDNEVRHLIELADFARTHEDSGCRHQDLETACWDQLWLGLIPVAGESLTNLMAQLLSDGHSGSLVASITSFEPPSAVSVFTSCFPGSSVTFGETAGLDPRKPLREVQTLVWAYDGDLPRPAVAPPSAAAIETIAQVADPRLGSPPAAYDAAIGLAGLSVPDLLGLLVHPVPSPAGLQEYPALWMRMVQAWACLGLLHHRADEPWAASARRNILVDLAYGPEDWITEAALHALAVAAWIDPSIRDDVASLVSQRVSLLAHARGDRAVTIDRNVAFIVRMTPQIDAAALEFAESVIASD